LYAVGPVDMSVYLKTVYTFIYSKYFDEKRISIKKKRRDVPSPLIFRIWCKLIANPLISHNIKIIIFNHQC